MELYKAKIAPITLKTSLTPLRRVLAHVKDLVKQTTKNLAGTGKLRK